MTAEKDNIMKEKICLFIRKITFGKVCLGLCKINKK